MSEESVEVLRRAFDAFASEGAEGMMAFVSPDVVVHPFPEWMEKPVYYGHDGFRELLSGWTEGFEEYTPTVSEFRDAGNGVVVWLGHNTGKIRGANIPIKQPVGGVHRFQDGLLVEASYYMTWPEALEAAGLSE